LVGEGGPSPRRKGKGKGERPGFERKSGFVIKTRFVWARRVPIREWACKPHVTTSSKDAWGNPYQAIVNTQGGDSASQGREGGLKKMAVFHLSPNSY